MSRIKWLLLLLLFCTPAKAVNNPVLLHRGSCNAQSGFTNTIACYVNNVSSGNTLLLDFQSASGSEVITSTESFTCPAGSFNNATIGGFTYRSHACYVVLASNHTSFSISITVSGGAGNIYVLNAEEWQGLGAVDGSSGANAANTLSLTVTTANSGEFIHGFCTDYAWQLNASGSNLQAQSGQANPLDVTNNRGLSEYQIGGAAGNYTVSCSVTNSSNIQQIVGLAFAVSSPPAPPSVQIIQECVGDSGNSGSVEQQCPLTNTTAGNMIVVGAIGFDNLGSIVCSPEACTCPAGAATNHTYSGHSMFISACYVKQASNHASFTVRVNNSGGVSYILAVYEVSGLSTFDAGCAAAATSCTYTTATANEWTWMWAADSQGNPMVAGNSFDPMGYTDIQAAAPDNQALMANKITVSSGSNTASYTQTASASPLISVLSFGPSATSVKHKGQIF